MPAVFSKEGVRFLYPENWVIDESPLEQGWSVAVQSPSPGTAFLMLSVHPQRPEVDALLQATLLALQEDYPEMDTFPCEGEEIAGYASSGCDVEFFTLDFANTCWIRSFRTERATYLVICQASDLDADLAEPVLKAMRASISVQEENAPNVGQTEAV
ncbi:MAG: hypothetical protein NZM31_12555 [Gemmatales bacterium]|nr:hypothetical protein [Gemmatales bacterium]MDW8387826.1 hypothetical protein [Gemmatales bacterium]